METGSTTITVSPGKAESNLYKVKVADEEKTVEYGDNVKNWTAWDGEADITTASGKIITVVEAGSDYKAVGAGSASVVARE